MKNFLILALAIFLLSSCTKEIYRGQVAYVDNQNILIDLYGMNKAIWTVDDELILSDFVEVTSTNNLKTFNTSKVCTPVLGHCHFDGQGVHNRIHIRDGGDRLNLTYNDEEYKSAKVWELTEQFMTRLERENIDINDLTIDQLNDRQPDGEILERFDVWIKKTFNFEDSIIYPLRLNDQEDGFLTINNRQLIKMHTTKNHPEH